MLSVVKSMCLQGLDGILVNVEVDISNGMPCWDVVGLPDTTIKESKERIRTAIKNCGIELLSRKYIINLSPANIKKDGGNFDLAIAVGILSSMNKIIQKNIEDTVFVGELSLNGKINKMNGILPICIEAYNHNIKRIVVPKENATEAAVVEGIEVIGVSNLIEVINFLNGKIKIAKQHAYIKSMLRESQNYDVDFLEVKGNEAVKRVLEIAAAGAHNCLMIGSPGCGKTMLARRIPSILPNLTFEEALEITKIHSIAGLLKGESLITTRPFRSPHHTITEVGLVGGGRIPKPGEISLAHYGVLFLDELLEFKKNTLEVLRAPMEDRKITISRTGISLTYPSNFILIASTNPCPCGYYGSKKKECICTENQRNAYKSKLSGPMLDRFDIQIQVPEIEYEKLEIKEGESSKIIQKRVNLARDRQIKRYKKDGFFSNSELTPKYIEKYCRLNEEANSILKNSFQKLNLSARAYSKILKVSRTIADLDDSNIIETEHILEAIQYRSLDRMI